MFITLEQNKIQYSFNIDNIVDVCGGSDHVSIRTHHHRYDFSEYSHHQVMEMIEEASKRR